MESGGQSVHSLRRTWKPVKEQLLARNANDPTVIRLHRAFSWMARVEAIESDKDDDLVLVCQWIAFNALYGRWDVGAREPVPDKLAWSAFASRLLAIDGGKRLSSALQTNRAAVMTLFEDEYLSAWFWEEPTGVRAGKSRKVRHDAKTWYVDGKWGMILERVLDRIYLLRCQLVHGASTFGGTLNRQSLSRCNQMLRRLLETMVLVMIDDGGKEDWGVMCYPPLRGTVSAG
jgi:hypothetical protein